MAITRWELFELNAELFSGHTKLCFDDDVAPLESELERVSAENQRLTAELAAMKEKCEDAKSWIQTLLPMAKGYAFANNVGNNVKMVMDAEDFLFPSPPSVQPPQEGGGK